MSLRFLGQDIGRRLKILNAGVSELADETDSKSVIRKGVWVRVPPPALENLTPTFTKKLINGWVLKIGRGCCKIDESSSMEQWLHFYVKK